VRATGFYQGEPVTSGRIYNIVPLPGRSVEVRITLGHVLQTFTVDPSSVSLPRGATEQLLANATFSDENDGDVSEQCTWTSSNTSIITVSMDPGSRGLAKAVGEGNAIITVVLQDQSLQVPVTVTARRLEGLSLAPSLLSLALGNSAVLQATAVYSDGDRVANVAHTVGVGLRVDLAFFGFIERATVRLDVAKSVNNATPVQFWLGVQHPF